MMTIVNKTVLCVFVGFVVLLLFADLAYDYAQMSSKIDNMCEVCSENIKEATQDRKKRIIETNNTRHTTKGYTSRIHERKLY